MKFGDNFNKLKTGLKIITATALGTMPMKGEVLVDNKSVSDIDSKTEIYTQEKEVDASTLELSQEYLSFINEFDNFEKQDSVPDVSYKYGYKKLGTRKFFKGTITVDYYGSKKTGEVGPYFAKQKKDDPVYKLGDVFPNMDGNALFYNYGPDGVGHLVELPISISVFRDEQGRVYATACGNLITLVSVGEIKEIKNEKTEQKKQEYIPQEFPTSNKKNWADFGQHDYPNKVKAGIAVTDKTLYVGGEIDPTYETWADYPDWADYCLIEHNPTWINYCDKYKNKRGFKHGNGCSCGQCTKWYGSRKYGGGRVK